MQIGHHLEFHCQECNQLVGFSVIQTSCTKDMACGHCKKKYCFSAEAMEKMCLFEALCRQIQESQSILSQTCIAVDLGESHVKIPFRLLLTRLNSVLELTIGDKKIEIYFRMNPVEAIEECRVS